MVLAGEETAMAMAVVSLPHLVAAISVAMSPVEDPEPDDIDIFYLSTCSGGVDLPVSRGNRAEGGQSGVVGAGPVVGKDVDVSSRPDRGDPEVVVSVTVTRMVLWIVVVEGARKCLGDSWVLVRPLAAFSLRKMLRLLALLSA